MDKFDFMRRELERLREQNLYRDLRNFSSAQTRHVELGGRRLLMLSSNSYLDLCADTDIQNFAIETARKFGTGSGGARLTTGSSLLTAELEKRLAAFKHAEAALTFNTGYMANLGTISAICDKTWTIFSDELNHASIIDGCRLSKAKIIVYRHNDMADLRGKISELNPEKSLIVSDGVFSMDGDIVKLPDLLKIADEFGAISMIDEAHATGVIGKTGRGTAEHFGMERGADISLGTLSKAIGSEGGFVCGSATLIEFLRNKARSFIFSTAVSPVTVAASLKALEKLMASPERTLKLQKNVDFFCRELLKNGISARSETAIVPIMIGSEAKATEVAAKLFERGYFVSAIRYPTVARSEARLRVTLMASHEKAELSAAAAEIARAIRG